MKKQLTSLALSVILTTATFGTALADNNFDTLRNKPMGAIEAGDALGLEVIPRSELEEVRGESFTSILKIAWQKSYPVRVLWQAYQGYDLAGWELGRMLAIRDGLPDPGPKPNTTLLQKVIYQAAR